jgi:parallel beta-helix repeat protein
VFALSGAIAAVTLLVSGCVPAPPTDPSYGREYATLPPLSTPVIGQSASAAIVGTTTTGGLDPSGATIPATQYPIPTGAVFMAPNGVDTGSGTIDHPVRSLTRAVDLVPASGGTIVVRGGVYRQWYSTDGRTVGMINKPLTIQAYPGEQPWFDGTDVFSTGWTQVGSLWSRPWSTPQFCGGQYDVAVDGMSPVSPTLVQDSPCTYADSVADPAEPVAGDPQLAYANGAQLAQQPALANVTPGSKSFYYDWYAKRLYVSEDPSTAVIELATRPSFAVMGGPLDFVVRGIGFRRYASSIRGDSVLYVGLSGPTSPGHAVFENDVFTQNAGNTLNLSGPKPGTVVRHSVFAFNQYMGLQSNGFASTAPGALDGLLIEGSVFNANNAGLIDTDCSSSCGAAGAKFNHMTGFTVRGNVFENSAGPAPGFWCDMNCSGGVIVSNTVHDNGGHGVFYEISNTGIIANNLIYDNGFSGIAVASANTKIYNNTLVNRSGPLVQAVWIFDDRRAAPDTGATWPYPLPMYDLGPNTANTQFANNLIVAQQPRGARLMNFATLSLTPPNTTSSQYFSVLDNNLYYVPSGQSLYSWGTTDAIATPAALRTTSGQNWETQTTIVAGTGDPFVNRAGDDFTVRAGTPPLTLAGRALPADVAAALGVTGPVGRGRIG